VPVDKSSSKCRGVLIRAVTVVGPENPGVGVFTGEVRERRGVGEHAEEVLATKVGAGPFDREPERVGEVVEIDVPFALVVVKRRITIRCAGVTLRDLIEREGEGS
jgi:hypothetical protein